MKKRILFVCTGNICRSPTAEAVFLAYARQYNLEDKYLFDSAGTHRYHIGDPPDVRTIHAGRAKNYDLASQKARHVEDEDFANFDLIFALDRGHLAHLRQQAPDKHHAEVKLLSDMVDSPGYPTDIPDPYYKDEAAFDYVVELMEVAAEAFFAKQD